ncbi:MAG: PHP domain-containing protein, partial [Lachnospiraceae bacterium]|nr:PHP domain-containing protein [Lachnospiraceae bacterium]
MKTLREAVPNIRTCSEIMDRMDEILVTRMTMPRDRSRLKVYLEAPFLIRKRDIYALEAAIKQAYFPKNDVLVRVSETFRLDGMSAEEAYAAYRDSILLELKTFSLMEYNLFRHAELSFPEEGIAMLTVPDSMVLGAKTAELAKYLEGLFQERLGFSLSVRVKNTRAKLQHADTEAEMAAEISAIAQRYRDAQEETEERQKAETAQKDKKNAKKYTVKRHFDPGEGFGFRFDEEPIALSEITEEMGDVVIQGQIVSLEPRELKTGNLLYIFVITDKTDSIKVKLFLKPEEKEEIDRYVAKDKFVRLKGVAAMDRFDREIAISAVSGIMKEEGTVHERTDRAPEKRVELHAHTQMSEMDAVTHTDELVKRAAAWGHEAVAITDHGVVQSFPDAMHAAEACAKKGRPIKIIYGCEGYLVDDTTGRSVEELKQSFANHVILLAKNDTGRINLYRLVSESHLKYFHKRPRIPKSLLQECREGLIIGAACEAGELYRALVNEASDEEIARLVNFYDYLEVQPIMNNAFMLRGARNGKCYTEEDLRNFVRRIVA